MGFGSPSTFEDWRIHSPGACLTPFVALTGFLALSAPCSPPGRPALFHAGDAHGVRPFRAFPSRGAVPPLGGRCPHDVGHSPWRCAAKNWAVRRETGRTPLLASGTARLRDTDGTDPPGRPGRRPEGRLPRPRRACLAGAATSSRALLPRRRAGPEGPSAAVASRAAEPGRRPPVTAPRLPAAAPKRGPLGDAAWPAAGQPSGLAAPAGLAARAEARSPRPLDPAYRRATRRPPTPAGPLHRDAACRRRRRSPRRAAHHGRLRDPRSARPGPRTRLAARVARAAAPSGDRGLVPPATAAPKRDGSGQGPSSSADLAVPAPRGLQDTRRAEARRAPRGARRRTLGRRRDVADRLPRGSRTSRCDARRAPVHPRAGHGVRGASCPLDAGHAEAWRDARADRLRPPARHGPRTAAGGLPPAHGPTPARRLGGAVAAEPWSDSASPATRTTCPPRWDRGP
jgi:hypothetical protein